MPARQAWQPSLEPSLIFKQGIEPHGMHAVRLMRRNGRVRYKCRPFGFATVAFFLWDITSRPPQPGTWKPVSRPMS